MATVVGNRAPFINLVFTITSKWWTYRDGVLHRGLDIATGHEDPVVSMLDGYVIDVGYNDSAGNYIIIACKDVNSGYFGFATRYIHLKTLPLYNVGDYVSLNEVVGIENNTGSSQGTHLHVEMQNVYLNTPQWTWHVSNEKTDYIDPTAFMGIDNVEGTQWIYYGIIPPVPSSNKHKFKWVLYANNIRKRNKL